MNAYIAELLPPPPRHNPHPERRLIDDVIVNNVEANIVHVEECTTPVTVNSVVNVEPWTIMRQFSAVPSAAKAVAKRKVRNMRFYKNKKARVHSSSTMTATMMTTTTSMTTAAAPDMDPWAVSSTGKVHTPAARKMEKQRRIKPLTIFLMLETFSRRLLFFVLSLIIQRWPLPSRWCGNGVLLGEIAQ